MVSPISTLSELKASRNSHMLLNQFVDINDGISSGKSSNIYSITGIAVLRIAFFLQSLIILDNTCNISKILALSFIITSKVYNATFITSGYDTLRTISNTVSRMPSMMPPDYI